MVPEVRQEQHETCTRHMFDFVDPRELCRGMDLGVVGVLILVVQLCVALKKPLIFSRFNYGSKADRVSHKLKRQKHAQP